MIHPKMRYTYVGIDSHKDTHTAVFLNCFYEKLGELTFSTTPSDFPRFLEDAGKLLYEGTEFAFGFEDISAYGRSLVKFLANQGKLVKHVNAALVAIQHSGCASCILDTYPVFKILTTLLRNQDFLNRYFFIPISSHLIYRRYGRLPLPSWDSRG